MSSEFEWHELVDRHLHGELNEAEKERLAEWLDRDLAARKAFVEQVQWDTHFSEAMRERSGSLRGPMTKHFTDLMSVEQTPIRRERRRNRIVTRSMLAAASMAAALLISLSSLIALIRTQREVTSLRHELKLARRDAAPVETDDSAVIHFYVREHQDIIARHASLSPAQPEPMQIQVSQEDILYYELLDGQPDTMYPGIIVRGPLSQGQVSSPTAPIISNGHTLSLSEAKETAKFNLVAPLRLHPGFELDQIRRIDGRDALQLLYTNGINSVSLFEQPLDGQRGLSRHDFREYAVYNKLEQEGVTILAWRDNALSYVLIGNAELSQLMNMSQSISAAR